MNKKTLLMSNILGLIIIYSAQAAITIDFKLSSTTTMKADYGAGFVAALGGTWVAELIFSPTATIGALDSANPLVPTGDDFVLVRLTPSQIGYDGRIRSADYLTATPAFVSGTSQIYNEASYSYGGSFLNGYVYARFFDSTTPSESSHYYESSAFQLTQSINPNVYNPVGADMSVAVVPEPGSFALCILGLATIMMRRKSKR